MKKIRRPVRRTRRVTRRKGIRTRRTKRRAYGIVGGMAKHVSDIRKGFAKARWIGD